MRKLKINFSLRASIFSGELSPQDRHYKREQTLQLYCQYDIANSVIFQKRRWPKPLHKLPSLLLT